MITFIFDLELVKRFKTGQPSEIVEIGACKVDLDSKSIVDDFQVYILPESGVFKESTRKFIHMRQEDVEGAVSFQEGIKQFKQWLSEEALLCSWGKDDKVHLVDQCLRHHMDIHWMEHYRDIQKPISKLLGAKKNEQVGLKNALQLAGIEPTGKMHRGIDDAINTAKLLIHFSDQIQLNLH